MPYGTYSASPSFVRQAPDNRALRKTTTLLVGSMELSTPPMAQEYFEPGVNTKLTRRTKPKTNYTLPSDMPTYALGFVPTNQSSGANGEEPAIVVVPESKPADLMDVFARIDAEQKALQKAPKYGVDMGTMVVREYQDARRIALLEKRVDSLMRDGYTEAEAMSAMEVVRKDEAIKKAKEAPKPLPVEQAIQEALGVSVSALPEKKGKTKQERLVEQAEKEMEQRVAAIGTGKDIRQLMGMKKSMGDK